MMMTMYNTNGSQTNPNAQASKNIAHAKFRQTNRSSYGQGGSWVGKNSYLNTSGVQEIPQNTA